MQAFVRFGNMRFADYRQAVYGGGSEAQVVKLIDDKTGDVFDANFFTLSKDGVAHFSVDRQKPIRSYAFIEPEGGIGPNNHNAIVFEGVSLAQ